MSPLNIAEFPKRKTPAPKKADVIPFAAPATPKAANKSGPQTEIVARIDIGFGNKLTIRGAGAGLNWEKGEAMEFADGVWSYSTASKDNFEFKVLINDQTWMTGENIQEKAGGKVVFKPVF
jgi:hypothetical protein